MDSDDDDVRAHPKLYNALRSDLVAALSAFDRAQDWADLIHDLQRVNRVLNKHESNLLPEKKLLAKRLAQCLTHSLPSGVHLKALETYHLVFTRIGTAKLARDLPLYAAGLFPVYSYCATTLKPTLLSLYENHFLPLGRSLSPVVDGFVLAVLPGLEDESSEFYGRTFKLLTSIGAAVGDAGVFSRGLWRALLLAPEMRLTAATFLRVQLAEDKTALREEMVADMPLVSYAIGNALSDKNALVQRGVLDLLLGELALDSAFFAARADGSYEAAVTLVGGVFGALMRRDISLTKRVHAWLLGGRDGARAVQYCGEHSKGLVLAAIDAEIASATAHRGRRTAAMVTRPYKIAAALLDRDEILECVGPQLALRVLSYGHSTLSSAYEDLHREIRHAFIEVVQQLGTASILNELERLLRDEDSSPKVDYQLLVFALSVLPMDDDIVQNRHLPALLRVAVNSLGARQASDGNLAKAVFFCGKALSMLSAQHNKEEAEADLVGLVAECVETFAAFFVAWLARHIDAAPVALRQDFGDVGVADEVAAELLMACSRVTDAEYISVVKEGCSFLMVAALSVFGGPGIVNTTLQAAAKCSTAIDVRMSLAGARAYAAVAGQWASIAGDDRGDEFQEQTLGVIRRAWRQLHPSLQTATPQSSQVFLFLQRQFPEQTKAVVADGILSPDSSRRTRNLERFACLWNHSIEHGLMPRPAQESLFLMLDALVDEEWGPKMLARSWLAGALSANAGSVLDAPLSFLLTPAARTGGAGHVLEGIYDAPRALYAFQVLRSILDSCSSAAVGKGTGAQLGAIEIEAPFSLSAGKHGRTGGIWPLAATPPSARIVGSLQSTIGPPMPSTLDSSTSGACEGSVELWPIFPLPNYVLTIAVTALSYLRGRVPDEFERPDLAESLKRPAVHSGDKSLLDEEQGETDIAANGDSDSINWKLAGLGFTPLSELHESVSQAAAECLASLLTSIPTPTRTSASVAHHLARPFLSLLTSVPGRLDPVLQLHCIDVVESLILCDGPAYRSTVGERNAPQADAFLGAANNAASNPQAGDTKVHAVVSLSAVEQEDRFLPWLLREVSQVCSPGSEGDGMRSQEVVGLRQRWIRFVSTVISHVGLSLPAAAEGLLVVLLNLLAGSNVLSQKKTSGYVDTDFSRLDDRVILLKAISVVSTNVLWSFELALSTNALSNEGQAVGGPGIENANAVRFSAGTQAASASGARSAPAIRGASPRRDSSSNSESALTGAANGHDDSSQKSSGATMGAAVVNAINPLRMLDFMKDVFAGAPSDAIQRRVDPRRAAARVLFYSLAEIVGDCTEVWGTDANESSAPKVDPLKIQGISRVGNHILHAGATHVPRLSKELPRERHQAQRVAVLSVLDPIFRLRPTDVVAAMVAQFVPKYDASGILFDDERSNRLSRTAVKIVHAIELTSAETVMTSTVAIAEMAMKWDTKGLAAADGKEHAAVREVARQCIVGVTDGKDEFPEEYGLGTVGQVLFRDGTSSIAGGSDGLPLSDDSSFSIPDSSPRRKELFCAGDYFAQYAPGDVEIACFRFLSAYFDASFAGNENQAVWGVFYELIRDVVGSSTRKATSVATLVALSSFCGKCTPGFPDKRARRDVLQVVASTVGACGLLAVGTMDLSNEPNVNDVKDVKTRHSVYALRGMARAIPVLVNAAFLEEKPQLSNIVNVALAPSVETLKRTSARAAAVSLARAEARTRTTPTRNENERIADDRRDEMAVSAAADLMFAICEREWGLKHARRELVGLLDDPHFFHGKRGGLMTQMTQIVREVMSGGGAASLLTSIGTHTVTVSGGIPVLFSGRDSEAVLRARAVRRIAFCVFVADPDHYAAQLPYVLERLRDALRIADANLVIQCLLCLRVLLLRTGPASIAAFRATTLSEVFRIAAKPDENVRAAVAALQFLDLNTLLAPPDNAYERCFFFAESSEGTKGEFEPLVARIARAQTAGVASAAGRGLRLQVGLTVFNGSGEESPDIEFVREYARVLSLRNASPRLATGEPRLDVLGAELAKEFIE